MGDDLLNQLRHYTKLKNWNGQIRFVRKTLTDALNAVEERENERMRCAEIARSLAYGDNEAVKAVCEQIAIAIETGASVSPTRQT